MLTLQNRSKRTLQLTQYDIPYVVQDIEGQCTLLAIQTITENKCKKMLVIILSILTLGVPLLLMHWFPRLKRALFYSYAHYDEATHFMVQNYDNEINIVEKKMGTFFDGQNERNYVYFEHRYLKYRIIDENVSALKYRERKRVASAMRGGAQGWSDSDAVKMGQTYGPGAMMIHQPTAGEIFIKQIFRPLYIFLLLNLGLQLWIEYYYFCFVIGISAIVGVVLTIIQVLRVNKQIHDMSYYEVTLNVLRGGQVKKISSLNIVPGDIVFFNDPIRLPFEGVILEGEMLMNQCVLTGQSVPVVKKAEGVDQLKQSQGEFDKNGIVYEGTTIVQVNAKKTMHVWDKYRIRYGVPVCVTRTNFATLKGQLVRKILYPDQTPTKFQQQSTKFLFFLFFLTVASYIIMTIHLHGYIQPWTLVRRGLDLITITVPPTLPISMTIGIIYSIKKLKAKDIFTISPNQLIEGGVLDTMCFDKTGTLTTDSMDFKALIGSQKGTGFDAVTDIKQFRHEGKTLGDKDRMALANMACNHTVVRLESTGELVGDPMEIELLKFSNSELQSQSTDPNILFFFSTATLKGQVLKRYDFDSTLQRMSVVATLNDSKTYIFAKGSPQIMLSIMDPGSVPRNYQQKLRQYASSGFRILAIASKVVQGGYKKTMTRGQIQKDLQFNGFEVFENGLKDQTRGAIQQLRSVNINPIMITGDNPITASNIGYQSAILDPDTKTIIVDFKQSKFIQQQFVYNIHDLAAFPYSRAAFKRKSPKGQNLQTQSLRYADSLLDKAQKNNYNICLTGPAFHQLFDNYLQQQLNNPQAVLHPVLKDIVLGSQIYSRTKPYDKSSVVVILQNMGRTVGFCGDGANDCAALSKANLGLSLSDTQASIAAAFTAKQRHIGSMVQLIKESRAGLATNFSLFNIIACYALSQYTASIIDQYFVSYPADFQFVYQDLFLNAFFVFILGNIATEDRLCKEKPSNSLFSVSNITQLVTFHVLQATAQILCIVAAAGPYSDKLDYYSTGGFEVNYQSYKQKGKGDFLFESLENNITFLVSNCFLLASIIGFIITKPWKKQFYTYWPFTVFYIAALIYTLVIIVVPQARWSVFKLSKIKSQDFCWFLFAVSVSVSLLIVFIQKCVYVPLFRWLKERKEEQEREEEGRENYNAKE